MSATPSLFGVDLPLIQAVVLTFAVLFIAINLAVDVLVLLLNPRLRGGGH